MRAPGPRNAFSYALAMGLAHALTFALSFPPAGLWWLSFVCALPLCHVAMTTAHPLRSALGVWLGAAPAWAFLHRWILEVTTLGFPGLVALLSLYPALFVLLGAAAQGMRFSGRILPSWLTLPVIWAGVEVFRGEVVLTGYPWYLLGQALGLGPGVENPVFLALAAREVGVYGLTLLLVGTTCVTVLPILEGAGGATAYRMSLVALRGGLCVIAWSVLVAGLSVIRDFRHDAPFGAPAVRVGIVQTNVAQDNKVGWTAQRQTEDFARFADLTRRVMTLHRIRPSVIVWPETMFPGLTLDPEATRIEREANLVMESTGAPSTVFVDALLELQREIGVPMLVGAIGHEGFRVDAESEELIAADRKFNSVFLISDGRVEARRYDKVHLTPFGEVMPYISRIDRLERALLAIGAGGMTFDLDAGAGPVRFALDGARIVTPVCFEATMPRVMRRLVGADAATGANLIVHVTNDGWFGDVRGGREMHALIARLRAIELGVPVVRVANTGVSCAFTASGRRLDMLAAIGDEAPQVAHTLGDRTDGAAIVDVRLFAPPTLFRRVGDVVGWACLLCTLVVGVRGVGLALRRRRQRAAISEVIE